MIAWKKQENNLAYDGYESLAKTKKWLSAFTQMLIQNRHVIITK